MTADWLALLCSSVSAGNILTDFVTQLRNYKLNIFISPVYNIYQLFLKENSIRKYSFTQIMTHLKELCEIYVFWVFVR